MITYDRSPFGINLLLRVNGSAIYRAMVPGFLSVVFLVLQRELWPSTEGEDTSHHEVGHPYAIGILVASITFLLVFRVQQAYARYWEAASAVHHFMSKWMDATMHTAVFHLQCAHYNDIKPPSFFDHPELNHEFLSRDRERITPDSVMEFSASGAPANGGGMTSMNGGGEQAPDGDDLLINESERVHQRATAKSIEAVDDEAPVNRKNRLGGKIPSFQGMGVRKVSELPDPARLEGESKLDGNWGSLFANDSASSTTTESTSSSSSSTGAAVPATKKFATYWNPNNPGTKDPAGFASHQGGRTAPLFLQELAHLSSLLTGVALSTLRNDIEGSQSPLDIYEAGSPWPPVDPTKIFESSRSKVPQIWTKQFWYFLGMGRSASERTRYNAGRPLPVIGGVSEAEIRFLQMARGPYAKTQLTWAWLSEFITREHLAGSLGKVGPPIVSRIIQFLGDGMIYYNHARKIMFIPFPFPHAQLSAFYVLVTVPAVAALMDQYAEQLWLGALLAFFTVTCLSGIHEVARELENPFRNIPNELPLVTLQAHYNEALITMYSGYHPDHFWKDEAKMYSPPAATTTAAPTTTATTAPTSVCSGAAAQAAAAPCTKASAAAAGGSSLNDQIVQLLQKIEQQGREIEQLQSQVRTNNSNDTLEDRKNR